MGTPQLLLWQEHGVPAVPHPAQVLVVPLQLSPLHTALSTRASHTISVPLAGIAHCPLRALWEVPLKVKVCNLSHSTTQPCSLLPCPLRALGALPQLLRATEPDPSAVPRAIVQAALAMSVSSVPAPLELPPSYSPGSSLL